MKLSPSPSSLLMVLLLPLVVQSREIRCEEGDRHNEGPCEDNVDTPPTEPPTGYPTSAPSGKESKRR